LADIDQYEREALKQFQLAGWETTVRTLWPTLFPFEFADFHKRTWEWASKVMPGEPAQDRITIWSRGTGKSSTAEGICAYWGIMRRRRYVWYVCATQQAADDHITTIGDLLTDAAVQKYFPAIANRKVDMVGTREAWRRNRLITSDGFAVDAVGMDTAVRGRKIGDQRPDAIIFDDIDDKFDTPENTAKKIEAMASKIIAAGTPHTVIIGAQNLITPTGIFASFANGTNTILTDSVVDGPIPAIYDLKTNGNEIIDGRPSWPEGMSLQKCQNLINQMGLRTFMLENQHDVHQTEGALWTREKIHYSDLPANLDEYNIGIDPAMSDGPQADLTGIYLAGLKGETIYLIDEFSGRHHPSKTKQIAQDLFWKHQCEIHIETDNGGEWLIEALTQGENAIPRNKVIGEKSRGVSKRGRAQPLADKSSAIAKDNRLFLCKKFEALENQMVSWVPSPTAKSPDHLDAAVWATSKWLIRRGRSARGYGYALG
jgi:hypothetical protein